VVRLSFYDRRTVPELPVIQSATPARADAARNRARIIAAAERLFAERGVQATTMEDIASAAGVGKGTVFRRFGDRASLVFALLDQTERAFQEAILRGPPPLGPGAPPQARLIAFGEAMLDRLERYDELLVEIEEDVGRWQRSQPYGFFWVHVRALLEEGVPGADSDYLTDTLLAVLSPGTFHHQRRVRGVSLERLNAGFGDLVACVFGRPPGRACQ
jgi:AcrR family transcriptional regulator